MKDSELIFKKRLDPKQAEMISALMEELGLVPRWLMTPSIMKMMHQELRQAEADALYENVNREEAKDFLENCVKHFHERENKKEDPSQYMLNFS